MSTAHIARNIKVKCTKIVWRPTLADLPCAHPDPLPRFRRPVCDREDRKEKWKAMNREYDLMGGRAGQAITKGGKGRSRRDRREYVLYHFWG